MPKGGSNYESFDFICEPKWTNEIVYKPRIGWPSKLVELSDTETLLTYGIADAPWFGRLKANTNTFKDFRYVVEIKPIKKSKKHGDSHNVVIDYSKEEITINKYKTK